MRAFVFCLGLAGLFAFPGSRDAEASPVGKVNPWFGRIVPEWTFTPRLRIVDASGAEISSPADIRDRDYPVNISFSVEVRETLGVISRTIRRKVGGHLGISSLGGAIYFTAADQKDNVDIPAMVSEAIDRLGPEDGFHSGDFIKFVSVPEGNRWRLMWLTAPFEARYLRGAWCTPEEHQLPGERVCEVSLGSIQVPVSRIPEGSSVSIKVGGPRVEHGLAIIKQLPYILHPYDLRPVVAEGNTVVLRVPL